MFKFFGTMKASSSPHKKKARRGSQSPERTVAPPPSVQVPSEEVQAALARFPAYSCVRLKGLKINTDLNGLVGIAEHSEWGGSGTNLLDPDTELSTSLVKQSLSTWCDPGRIHQDSPAGTSRETLL
eukprot:g30687.t1